MYLRDAETKGAEARDCLPRTSSPTNLVVTADGTVKLRMGAMLSALLRGIAALVVAFGLSGSGHAQAISDPTQSGRSADPQATNRVEEQVVIDRSGRNDCVDLPRPPEGVPGLREYARFDVTRDGSVTVRSARLPFSRNEGFLYRLTRSGWVRNEADFILIRMPLPVLGGYTYVITFGTGEDRCGPWSIEAVHPG